MIDTTNGTVLAVATVTLGDELAADAATGSTTITVTDAADFAETGGTLMLNGQLIDYTACDDETGEITLVDPLASDGTAADAVNLADPSGALASELRATVQVIGTLDSDEPIEAIIAHPIVPLLPEGIRDPGTGESVTLEQVPAGEWQVTNVHGRKPIFDADNAHYSDNVITGGQVDSSSVSISGTVAGSGTSDALASNVVAVGPFSKAGTNSTAVGVGALASTLVGGSGNTAVGRDALSSLTSGEFNTVVGTFSGLSIDTGNHNTVIGEESALDLVDGDYNTFLGQDTGNGHTLLHGFFNTFVGCLTSVTADTSGTVTIGVDSAGNGATATADDEFVLGTSNHLVQVPGRLNVARRTPSGTADTQGAVGDITSDDSFIYVKTSAGWKRSALSTF